MYKRFGSYNAALRMEHAMRVYPDGRAVLTVNEAGREPRQVTLNFHGFTPEQEVAAFIAVCQMAERWVEHD